MSASDEPAPDGSGNRSVSEKRCMPRGEVHIFDNWCKGCGLCIEFCPAGVLVLGSESRPRPIYPEKCTACRWCELHCPDFAIFVTDLLCEPEQSSESPVQPENHAPEDGA